MAPPFKKLKNPVLRRTVAKIASLRQAAAVGGIDVEQMVNHLRAKVGQEPMTVEAAEDGVSSYFSAQPAWYEEGRVIASINESDVDPQYDAAKTVIAPSKKTRRRRDHRIGYHVSACTRYRRNAQKRLPDVV